MVLLRGWHDILTYHGETIPISDATARFGVFALRLDQGFHLKGQCALVENPALFFSMERLSLPAPVAILSRGFASARLLEWLSAQKLAPGAIIHLPDYDPVGLWEFLRIHQELGDRVCLHTPADLEERFRRYSNPGLLYPLRSSDILRRVRASQHPSVQAVLRLLDQFGAGLEQEGLLLPLE